MAQSEDVPVVVLSSNNEDSLRGSEASIAPSSEPAWRARVAAMLPTRWPTMTEVTAPWMQLVTCIPGDLASLSWPQGVFLLLFGVWSIIFSFIDFNFFLKPDLYLSQFKWRNDTENGVEYWRRVLFALSGAASFTGALSVVMASKGRYSNFAWGWINIITYGLYALAYGYAGDAQMNLIVFPVMQIVGQYQWQGQLSDGSARVNVMNPLQWFAALALGVLVAVAFYFEIPAFAAGVTGAYFFEGVELPRRLDATANAMNVVAMILLMNRHVEQWAFWIGVDCVQIVMFTGVAGYGVDANVVSMWTLFQANALWGAYIWLQRWRAQVVSDAAAPGLVDAATQKDAVGMKQVAALDNASVDLQVKTPAVDTVVSTASTGGGDETEASPLVLQDTTATAPDIAGAAAGDQADGDALA